MEDIHARKELEVGQKIIDYMGSTELIFILMMLCVGNEIVSPLVTQLSWTNQLLIMSGCKSNDGIAISVATPDRKGGSKCWKSRV